MTASEQRRRTLVLWLCCLAQFMVILDVSIVNIALPSIREELGFSAAGLQWVVNAYTLTFAGFLLLGGRAADLAGRRPVFVGGLGLFTLASLAAAVAQTEGMLIAARAAQGLGSAIVAPTTLSILTTTFTEGTERNRALALWGAMGGIGGTVGVLLSGVIVEVLGWRWIFFINVPVGVVAAVAALRVVARDAGSGGGWRTFDLTGAVVVTAGLVALTYGIVSTETHGWTGTVPLVSMGLGVALLALFVLVEGRLAQAPLMPLRIFRVRTLSSANVVILCMGAAAFSMWYFLSLYLQQVLGETPLEAGLGFMPAAVVLAMCSQVAGRLVGRVGAGKVLTAGMTLIALGLLGLSRVSADGSYVADALGPSVVVAAGIGASFVSVTIAATAGVRRAEAGLASGLLQTSRQVGGTIGLALLATLATQRTEAVTGSVPPVVALTEGFQRAYAVAAVFALVGAVVALLLLARVRPASAAPAVERAREPVPSGTSGPR